MPKSRKKNQNKNNTEKGVRKERVSKPVNKITNEKIEKHIDKFKGKLFWIGPHNTLIDSSIKSVTAEDGVNIHSSDGSVTVQGIPDRGQHRMNERGWKTKYAKYYNGIWVYNPVEENEKI